MRAIPVFLCLLAWTACCSGQVSPPASAPEAGADAAMQRYSAEDYSGAARLGLGALAREPDNRELRFAVANSLAWTDRYGAAMEQYEALLGSDYDARARVGLGNVVRWRGRPDLAERFYSDVLGKEPDNADARAGLDFAERELRPALTTRLARSTDNQGMARNEFSAAYRRWTADRRFRWEAAALLAHEESADGKISPKGVLGSAWWTRVPLAPQLQGELYDSRVHGTHAYATLQLEPLQDQLRLRAGTVNWSRLAFSRGASSDNLSARTLGINGYADTFAGVVRARLDGYRVSDGNRIVDGEAQLTPAWQPLPAKLVWYGGAYVRHADRQDPRYWSPRPAYGLGFVGLRRAWYSDRTDITATVQRGWGFTDTAGHSWKAALAARRWIHKDLALGVEAWAINTPRPESYRMAYVSAFLQQLF